MEKRETCIKIMEAFEEWLEERGFETSSEMDRELALQIWNDVICKNKSVESINERRIRDHIEQLKDEPQLQQKDADIHINAPLALIQLELKSKIKALEWVLENK